MAEGAVVWKENSNSSTTFCVDNQDSVWLCGRVEVHVVHLSRETRARAHERGIRSRGECGVERA